MDLSKTLAVAPLYITTFHSFFSMGNGNTGPTAPAARSWPTANLALYYPFSLPFNYNVRRMFWVNGTSIGSNFDIGIYTRGGGKIWSAGATAQNTVSVVQYVTPSPDFWLMAGRAYYLGISCSGTTSRAYGNVNLGTAQARLIGILQETGANPLPTSMTPVTPTNSDIQLCGFTSSDN